MEITSLDPWDKELYEKSLDLRVVAWPSHYVAATQDFARELERGILEQMQEQSGWALSGNLSVLTWLALTVAPLASDCRPEELRQALETRGLAHPLVADFTLPV